MDKYDPAYNDRRCPSRKMSKLFLGVMFALVCAILKPLFSIIGKIITNT